MGGDALRALAQSLGGVPGRRPTMQATNRRHKDTSRGMPAGAVFPGQGRRWACRGFGKAQDGVAVGAGDCARPG